GDTVTAAIWFERAADDTSSLGDRRSRMVAGVKAARWQGRWDDVVRRATDIADSVPDDAAAPTVLLWGAMALEDGVRDPRAAELLYERVLSLPGGSAVADAAAYGAARCAHDRGDATEAKGRLEKFALRYGASPLATAAAADLRAITLFELRDRETGTEQLALLLGDVIGEQKRSALAYRLAEISFAQLKNYELARTQYLRALNDGLDASLRPVAWHKAAWSASAESERPGLARGVRERMQTDAIALYDSLIEHHRDHPLAEEAVVAATIMRAQRVGSVAELRALAQRVDSVFATNRWRDRMFAAFAERAEMLKATDEALGWWTRAAGLSADQGRTVEARYRTGALLSARGDRDTAFTILNEIAERSAAHPRAVAAALLAANLAAVRGDRASVDRLTERALRAAPYAVDRISVLVLRADAAFAAQAWQAAADLYGAARTAIEQDRIVARRMPAESAFRMAIASQRIGRNDEASRLFGEVVTRESDPQVLLASYTALSMLAEARNDLPRASSYMQEAARVSAAAGGDANAVALESADLLFRNEQYADAVTRYSDLQSRNPSDSLRQRLEARTITSYLRLDNLREADRRIGAFVKKYPRAANEVAEFEFERGKHLLRKERTDLARERFELVVRQYAASPTAPEAWYWLGRTYELDQDLPRAVEVYDSVLQRYPNHPITPRLRLSLGNVLYTLEQWGRAALLFKSVLDGAQGAPESVQYTQFAQFAMNNLILTYKEQNLFDAALQLTRTYIERYPDDPELMNKRIDIGVLYQKLGYYDQSITHLQNLMQSAGSDLEAELRYYIGEAYHFKGDHQQAILEFLKVPYLVTRRGPVDWVSTSYYMAGQSYEKMSRFDQAIAMYRQIIERPGIDPTFKTAAQREIDRVNQLTGKRN
ncbi:MAG: tetratricopeptide repeat protein, partial [Bacteroidota bacterium]